MRKVVAIGSVLADEAFRSVGIRDTRTSRLVVVAKFMRMGRDTRQVRVLFPVSLSSRWTLLMSRVRSVVSRTQDLSLGVVSLVRVLNIRSEATVIGLAVRQGEDVKKSVVTGVVVVASSFVAVGTFVTSEHVMVRGTRTVVMSTLVMRLLT